MYTRLSLCTLARSRLVNPARHYLHTTHITLKGSSATKATAPSPFSAAAKLNEELARRNVTFYESPPAALRTLKLIYVSAILQLIFWGNLATLADYIVVESPPPSTPEAKQGFQLAPRSQRLAIGAGLATMGVLIAGAMCVYPWRYVRRITFLKGSTHVSIDTFAWVPRFRTRVYPIKALSSKQKVYTNQGLRKTDPINDSSPGSNSDHIFLRVQGERLAYLLNRKGKFADPKVFDGIWYQKAGR